MRYADVSATSPVVTVLLIHGKLHDMLRTEQASLKLLAPLTCRVVSSFLLSLACKQLVRYEDVFACEQPCTDPYAWHQAMV